MSSEIYVGMEVACLLPGHGECPAEIFQYSQDTAYCVVLDGNYRILSFSLITGENLDGLPNCCLLLPNPISN